MELISVIIPAYNVEKYIEKCINSVINQTYPNWELIIVNDASTDRTSMIVEGFREDPRIRIINNPENLGCYKSINTGIMASKGQLITILGGDDTYHIDKIKLQHEAIESSKNKIACLCGLTRNGYKICNVSSIMFKKDVVDTIGFYDSVRYGADSEFVERIIRVYGANNIVSVSKVLYVAIARPHSLTQIHGRRERDIYVRNYRDWHRSSQKKIISFPLTERPFPIPNGMS